MAITIQHPQGNQTGFKRMLFVGAAGVAALLAVVAGQSVLDDTNDANPASSVTSSSEAPAVAGVDMRGVAAYAEANGLTGSSPTNLRPVDNSPVTTGRSDLQAFGEMIIATGPPSNSLGPITRPEPATLPVDAGSDAGVYQTRGTFSSDVEWLTANGWLTSPGASEPAISAERAHFLTINDVGTATAVTAPQTSTAISAERAHFLTINDVGTATAVTAPAAVDYQPRGNFSTDAQWMRANGWLTSGS